MDGFLSYNKPTVFNLSETGITLICGTTGSGKSSIFEAVYYLLYGNITRSKSSVGDLVHKNGGKDQGYDISLDFSSGSDEYVIREIRGREGAGLFFSKNGKDIRGSDTVSTRKKIVSEVGLSEDDFNSLCFIGQEQTHTLISGTPSARAKEIVRVFGLDKYDEAIKLADIDLKEANASLVSVSKEIESQKKIHTDLESDRDSVILYDIDSGRISELEQSVEKVNDKISKIKVREQELLGKKKSVRARLERMESRAQAVQENQSITKRLSEIGDVKFVPCLLEKATKRSGELQRDLSSAQLKVKKANSFSNVCPIIQKDCPCNVPVTYQSDIVREQTEKISSIKSEIDKVQEEIRKMSGDRDLCAAKDKMLVTFDDNNKLIHAISDSFEDVDESEIDSSLLKCKQGLDSGKNKLDKLKEEYEGWRDKKVLNAERQDRINKINATLSHMNKESYVLTKELGKLSSDALLLEQTLGVLKKLKAYKIETVFDTLNANVSKNLSIISNNDLSAEFVTQKANASGKKVLESIDIMVDDGIKKLPIGMMSGGQRAQICVSVLLSVFETARELSDKSVSSLWLDEVFGPISLDVIDRVFEALVSLTKRIGVSSVKIITHKEIDTKMVDRMWRTRLINGATEVEIE